MRRSVVFAFLLKLAFLAAAQDSIRWKNPHPHNSVAPPAKRTNLLRSHLAIEFATPPSAGDLAVLRERGAVVLRVLSDRAFVVSEPDFFSTLGLNVTWSGRLTGGEKFSVEAGRHGHGDRGSYYIAEFYPDVDMNDARSVATASGMRIVENPGLLDHDLLVQGTLDALSSLAEWDEVEYIYPAAIDLVRGVPLNACAGALTSQGTVSSTVPTIGDGWDGPGRNAAALNYAFVSITEKLPADSAKSEIVRAFSEWAKYAKLTFTPATNSSGARTLAVLFAQGPHGDAYPFDGPGGMLAHTFYPYPSNPEPVAGDLHFDDDEGWRIGLDTDLFSIALHETGHALGLGHSDNPADVMYPYYRRVTGLAPGDIAAILTLYATQDGTPAQPLEVTIQFTPISTSATSVTLNGGVTGGTGAVQVSWRAGALSGVARGTTAWTASIPLSLGANAITITAVDSQRNTASATIMVTRLQPAANTAIRIVQPSSAYTTAAATITVTGTASDSTGIDHVAWSNSRGGSGVAAGTLAWSAGPIALGSGSNTITVTGYGKGGGMASATIVITYAPPAPANDTTPPNLTILSPAGTSLSTSATTIVFSGTASDNVGLADVTWTNSTGGSGTASGTSNWKTVSIPLLVGTNTITIRASDAAGNIAWRSVIVTRH